VLEIKRIGGFPHSEICGSKVAHTSPQLIAACHVLHRLYAPRHPRIALTSRLRAHTTNISAGQLHGSHQLGRATLVGLSQVLGSWLAPREHPWVRGNNLSLMLRVHGLFASRYQPCGCRSAQSRHLAASILRTHSQCQRGSSYDPSKPPRRRGGTVSLHHLVHSVGNAGLPAAPCRRAWLICLFACGGWWSLSGSNR
jgi:hypothetical protein